MKPKFYRKVLKNGMTVILEKRNIPVVSVAFAVKCGGINESAKEKGISHFIEHMLYKGTKKRSAKQIAEEIEKRGGDLNGFTDETITAFWCKMPSKHLRIALDVLGDMVKNPVFDEKELEKEKHVIFEEIKLYKDNPQRYIFEEIHRSLFKEPFGIPLIGDFKTVGSFTKKQVLKRFNETYSPKNMVLCVVGNTEFKDLVNFAEKTFEKRKGKIPNFKIKKRNRVGSEKRKGIGQANLVFAHHIPTSKNKKNHAALALNVLMAGGMSSRLFTEIREKRNLAYGVKGGSEIHKDYASSYIYVGTKKENVTQVKKIILKEFEKVGKELNKQELEQIKEQIIGQNQLSMEDSQTQMVKLLLYELNGNAKNLYDFEKKIRAVKLKDVKGLAKQVTKKYSFFSLIPDK